MSRPPGQTARPLAAPLLAALLLGAAPAPTRGQDPAAEHARQDAWERAYQAGVQAIRRGDLRAAAAHFEEAGRLEPDRPAPFLDLGTLYERLGELDRAARAYRRALDILNAPRAGGRLRDSDPWRDRARHAALALARVLERAGRPAEAAGIYGAILAEQPADITARLGAARAHLQGGELAAARRHLDILAARTDLPDTTYIALGQARLHAQDIPGAITAFRTATIRNPDRPEAWHGLAGTLYLQLHAAPDQGRSPEPTLRELEGAARRLLELEPRNRPGFLFLADACRALAERARTPAARRQARSCSDEAALQHQSLAFELSDLAATEDEGEVRLAGTFRNRTLPAGTPVRLLFLLTGDGGAPLASRELRLTAPRPGEPAPIEVGFSPARGFRGWRYAVLEPAAP